FNLTGASYKPPQWDEPIPYPIKEEFSSTLSGTHIKALYPWLEGRLLHRSYLRLSPREIERDPVFRPLAFSISGSLKGKYNCPYNFMYKIDHRGEKGYIRTLADDEGYVVCMAISENYDEYLKNAWKMREIQKSTDIATIYLRDNLSTNIKDDKGNPTPGILGCKVERLFQWSLEGTYIDYDRSGEPSSFQDLGDRSGLFSFDEREELGI
ncbi:MAG: hypothetical protein IJ603_07490, partial [Bacteroidales bacterium]|nr:hypothetical protein [Bacteroidales bacterium]